MAKCNLCNARKGKRQCKMTDGTVCTLCCGQNREAASCAGCVFYQAPQRPYHEVPAYSVTEVHDNENLLNQSQVIEHALCVYDNETGGKMRDSHAIRILELLLDKYHFAEDNGIEDEYLRGGFACVNAAMEKGLEEMENEEKAKMLSIIRLVARRRTDIGKEYMEIIHKYTGAEDNSIDAEDNSEASD
uniref:Uncharacterized protein n=1 Tax=Candidatus Kentrum sp. DK TaxID=2126562 RepID=A0A450SH23_9GAMM|nr:MAG: hypothetical protein BECKDK2373C_GA0170839_10369 [Candidatus Kentron sp. DK]